MSHFDAPLCRLRRSLYPVLSLCILGALSPSILLAANPSATSLAIASGGNAATSVPAGTLVTLTASVTANGASASPGRVIFCDLAISTFCSDLHKIGTAQVISTGAAIWNFYPGAGTHNYIAQFIGTTSNSASTSSAHSLAVTGMNSTSTTLTSVAGAAGTINLSAAVTGVGGSLSPTGNVSLIDTSNNSNSLVSTALTPGRTTLGLRQANSLATGAGPSGVAVADFNNDGISDIAIANPGTPGAAGGPLTIMIGNGDGTFRLSTSPATSYTPSLVLAADFNSDGNIDLATDGGILLGNGNGMFAPDKPYGIGPGNLGIAVADFNSDGHPDLAVILSNHNTIIMAGIGDGTFSGTPIQVPAATENLAVAVGDFNGDGIPDLTFRTNDSSGQGEIGVLLGNGDFTFNAMAGNLIQNDYSTSSSVPVVVGDFNGDAIADIAVGVASRQTAGPNVFAFGVYLGQGAGRMSVETITTTAHPSYALGIAAADFNGDGKTDIAFVDDVQTGIMLSNGDGTFTPSAAVPETPTIDPSNDTLAIGDFNGDGVPDIAQANSDLQTVPLYLTSRSSISTAAFANVAIPGAAGAQHNVQARYSGDASFTSSTSNPLQLAASPIPTPLGTATLSSGVAVLNTTSLPVGTDSITATYNTDGNFRASTSTAVPVAISAIVAPAVTLSSTNLTFASQTVGTTSAAQMVTLTNSGTAPLALSSISVTGPFATSNNCGTSVAAGASCTLSVTFVPVLGGTSTGTITITDNVAPIPTQIISLAGTATGLSITTPSNLLTIAAPGQSAGTTVIISSLSNFTGIVNLTCAVTWQGTGTPSDPPTCTTNPTQANLTSAAPITATVTVSTTAASASAAHDVPWRSSGIALAAFFFLGLVPRRRWRGAMLFSILGLAILGGVLGCSGGSKPPAPPAGTTSDPGTTLGNYKVTVTATSGVATMSIAIPLTLQ